MMRRQWVAGIVVVAVLGGCGSTEDGIDTGSPDRLHGQARDALTRYDEAVRDSDGGPAFVPIGEPIGQRGDWEVATGDNNKQALSAGFIDAAMALPQPPGPTGTVTWASGETRTVRLIGALEALGQVAAVPHGDCSGCTPLAVTGARLSTQRVESSRGPATVPVWEYTLRGTAVRVTVLAVDRTSTVRVVPRSWDPYNAPGGLAVESAATTARGRELTVAFTGSPGPASEPCGADYTAEAVESDRAVVIIVEERRHASDDTCPAIGARRTAVAALAAPLGDRAVLEVQQGLPVPVTVRG